MGRVGRLPRAWARWLASHCVPSGHIALILDCPVELVDSALSIRGWQTWARVAPYHRRSRGAIRAHAGRRARRLAELGYAPDRIATLLRFEQAAVAEFLRPPAVCGTIATAVRRLHADGVPAAAIAGQLGLDPAAVADFLERITPRQGASLSRPRSRREQAALAEWSRFEGVDAGLASGPPPAPPRPRPMEIHPPRPCGDWGPVKAAEHHPRKLSAGDVGRLWALRNEGLSRRELAEAFGISVATVGRIIKAGPPPAEELEEDPPPATAADGPGPGRWREQKRNRGPAWRDD